MKTDKFLLFFITVFSIFVIAACGSSTESDGNEETNKIENKENNSENETIEWKLFAIAPSNEWTVETTQWWADEIEKKSDGKLKITIYPLSLPYKQEEALDITDQGLVDVAMLTNGALAGTEPALSVIDLPGLMPEDPEQRWKILQEMLPLYDDYLKSKYNVIAYSSYMYQPRNIYSSKPFRNLEEAKGAKIRSIGEKENMFTQELGMSPTAIAASEIYNGIQTGVLDGSWNSDQAQYTLKAYEVAPYLIELNVGGATCIVIINNDSYEKLPDDVKEVIQDMKSEYEAKMLEAYIEAIETGRQSLLDNGMEVINWSEQDLEQVQNAIDKVTNSWKENASPEELEFYEKSMSVK